MFDPRCSILDPRVPGSNIEHRASSIEHRTSNIEDPGACLGLSVPPFPGLPMPPTAPLRRPLGRLELVSLSDGFFRLDGGAMFGIVPKPLWERRIPADDRNRIRLALRPLLVRAPEGSVLVETGIGSGFTPREEDIYALEGTGDLVGGFRAAGLDPAEVRFVVNTHLHFDHTGGNTVPDGSGGRRPAFPGATWLLQEREWIAARAPSLRSRGSFRPENFDPLEAAGVVERLDGEAEPVPGVRLLPTPGHTAGHQSVRIESGGETAFFFGDLIPTAAHLDPAWVMSYDLFPQETAERKREILEACAEGRWLAVFPHDPVAPWGRVVREGKAFRFVPE
jgi:glyoxylase-like metal-dependent hydrolase (beta-lactamase superfamily II)